MFKKFTTEYTELDFGHLAKQGAARRPKQGNRITPRSARLRMTARMREPTGYDRLMAVYRIGRAKRRTQPSAGATPSALLFTSFTPGAFPLRVVERLGSRSVKETPGVSEANNSTEGDIPAEGWARGFLVLISSCSPRKRAYHALSQSERIIFPGSRSEPNPVTFLWPAKGSHV